MKIKNSETKTILRSQINMNPYNPKRHSDEAVKEQIKNFKRVGSLGGIVVNLTTGNLIDGHKRLMALDTIYKYDGTNNDYSVKVEATEMEHKEELEQMTFMAMANTKADYELVSKYLPEIDPSLAGINEFDLQSIEAFLPQVEDVEVETIDDLLAMEEEVFPEERPIEENVESPLLQEEKKAHVKEVKQASLERASERYKDLNAYLTISFTNAEEKRVFCELAGIGVNDMFILGSKALELLE